MCTQHLTFLLPPANVCALPRSLSQRVGTALGLAEPRCTHQCPDLWPEHRGVLAVLAFQAIDVALHLEGGVGDGRWPRGQEAARERGSCEESVLAVGDDELGLQEQLLTWKAGHRSGFGFIPRTQNIRLPLASSLSAS